MEKLFPADVLSKRERVERTLRRLPVDRVALHEQLSYNPRVIARYTGKPVAGFDYTLEDIGLVIRKTLDMCFPPVAPCGAGRVTTPDGFVFRCDHWTRWRVSRPFDTPEGARRWLEKEADRLEAAPPPDPDAARAAYRAGMKAAQRRVGETVILDYSATGFCGVYDAMGLELFAYFSQEDDGLLARYLELSTAREEARIRAVADPALAPAVLIPEDFATKHGPIFSPAFLRRFHFPYVRRLARAWHGEGICVLYHSDGNWKAVLPDLIACEVDGFYCLEPGVGMDAVALKRAYPALVWAGGIDGVDLLERGTPAAVRAEVRRHILETDALRTGGLFIASSSEINPPIPPENFAAMVEAVGELTNPAFPRP